MNLRNVRAAGGTVAVREWGDPAGASLVFWHALGWGASGASFDVAAGPLAAAGFHVIAIDAPGFGRSPAHGADVYGFEQLAALLWAVADGSGIDEAVIVGHSWGATVAVFTAASHPERTARLVLYDSGFADFADLPSVDLSSTRGQLIERAEEGREVDSWERLVELARSEGLDQPWMLDAWREATIVAADGRVSTRESAETLGRALYEAYRARPSERWPALAEARIPTLLVLATEPPETRETNERLLPRFLDAVPQAEVVRPGCRHQVFADLGPRAGELVADWLRTQGSTRRS